VASSVQPEKCHDHFFAALLPMRNGFFIRKFFLKTSISPLKKIRKRSHNVTGFYSTKGHTRCFVFFVTQKRRGKNEIKRSTETGSASYISGLYGSCSNNTHRCKW
jgi:hypothetical protein